MACAALAATVAGSDAAAAAPATFPAGAWSAGVEGGIALVQMKDVKEILSQLDQTAGARFDALGHMTDFAVDVRRGLPARFFIGLEAGRLRGRAVDRAGRFGDVQVTGYPVQVIGGMALGEPSDLLVRIVGGVGAVVGAQLTAGGAGQGSGAAPLASLGGELEYRFHPAWALTVQAIARQARATRPGRLAYDLDYTGGTFRLGVRVYRGARRR